MRELLAWTAFPKLASAFARALAAPKNSQLARRARAVPARVPAAGELRRERERERLQKASPARRQDSPCRPMRADSFQGADCASGKSSAPSFLSGKHRGKDHRRENQAADYCN